jgi:hypothetical protein
LPVCHLNIWLIYRWLNRVHFSHWHQICYHVNRFQIWLIWSFECTQLNAHGITISIISYVVFQSQLLINSWMNWKVFFITFICFNLHENIVHTIIHCQMISWWCRDFSETIFRNCIRIRDLVAASTGFKIGEVEYVDLEYVDLEIPESDDLNLVRISVVKMSYFLSWSDFDIDECPPRVFGWRGCDVRKLQKLINRCERQIMKNHQFWIPSH